MQRTLTKSWKARYWRLSDKGRYGYIRRQEEGVMKRTYEEMMDLILGIAREDERVRAVTMEGSLANENAVHDKYSDFDISYYVRDIREFTVDKNWVKCFGDILIMQCPDDWYDHPYDYEGHESFGWLIQFRDGNRIDLTLTDVRNIAREAENKDPRTVLMNKDNFKELIPISSEEVFYIKKPDEREYALICNEFRWVSIYVTKGLCRKEIYYAKRHYDVNVMAMFIRMLNWKVGIDHGFKVTTGSSSKYLKRYLTKEEMDRFRSIFPNGEYEDIWDKLFILYDYFAELAEYVADRLGYFFDMEETRRVRDFMMQRKNTYIAENGQRKEL